MSPLGQLALGDHLIELLSKTDVLLSRFPHGEGGQEAWTAMCINTAARRGWHKVKGLPPTQAEREEAMGTISALRHDLLEALHGIGEENRLVIPTRILKESCHALGVLPALLGVLATEQQRED